MGDFRAVIFDFGGVFTTSPLENFAVFERSRDLPAGFIGDVIKARLHDGAFARYERAEVDFEAFDELFAEETSAAGFRIGGRDFLRLLDVDPKPEMAAALFAIKHAGFRTGCITNNFPSPPEAVRRADLAPVFNGFDHVIESSKAGVRKPEPRIYEMMLEALDLPAKACIFLDDLGVNLKPAQVMGMRTIKVPYGDVRPAIAELAAALRIDLS